MMRELASKIGFTEGPVWTGERLLVTSISRGEIYEVPLDGAAAHAVGSTGGGPNGTALLSDGAVLVAQNGGHVITQLPEPVIPPGLQRWTRDGSVEYVLSEGLQAPNDLAVAPDGAVWFTDPHPVLDRETPRPGRVWRWDPSEAEPELRLDGRPHPNGLAFSPDGDALYIVETVPRYLWRYPLRENGRQLGDGELLCTLDGEPDGVAVDVEGRVAIACHLTDEAIVVCSPEGELLERIDVEGAFATNLCYAGQELTLLAVSAPRGGRVLGFEREIPGLPLPPARGPRGSDS
jgi:gluconolactonase